MTFRSLLEQKLGELDDDASYQATFAFLHEMVSEAANLKAARVWRREKEEQVPPIPHETVVKLTEELRVCLWSCGEGESERERRDQGL